MRVGSHPITTRTQRSALPARPAEVPRERCWQNILFLCYACNASLRNGRETSPSTLPHRLFGRTGGSVSAFDRSGMATVGMRRRGDSTRSADAAATDHLSDDGDHSCKQHPGTRTDRRSRVQAIESPWGQQAIKRKFVPRKTAYPWPDARQARHESSDSSSGCSCGGLRTRSVPVQIHSSSSKDGSPPASGPGGSIGGTSTSRRGRHRCGCF